MKHLEYKGYVGTIEFSPEDNMLFGKVLGIQSLLSYEGQTGKELASDFEGVIDEYLEDCKAQNIKPEKPFKGSFNVRVPSKIHQKAALLAMEAKMSLNAFVLETLRSRIFQESKG